MKGMIGMTAGLVTGAVVGTAVAICVKQLESRKHCGSKAKKVTSMAFNAMGEAFHNLADHVK